MKREITVRGQVGTALKQHLNNTQESRINPAVSVQAMMKYRMLPNAWDYWKLGRYGVKSWVYSPFTSQY